MFTVNADLPKMKKWLMDSGTLSHMTHQKEFLLDYGEFATPENVEVGDRIEVKALNGIENVRLSMRFKVSESKRASYTAQCLVCTKTGTQSIFSESCSQQK